MIACRELPGIGRDLLTGSRLMMVVAGLRYVVRAGVAVMRGRYGGRGRLRSQALLSGNTISGESDRRQPDQCDA